MAVLSEKRAGTKVISIRRKYVNELNQVCHLDSNYEYDYALYLDDLYRRNTIAGWVRNTTLFAFTEPVNINSIESPKYTNSHRPDFFVFNHDGTYEIHECKGWMNRKAIAVDKAFRRDFPGLTYKIIGKSELKTIQLSGGKQLFGWVKIA